MSTGCWLVSLSERGLTEENKLQLIVMSNTCDYLGRRLVVVVAATCVETCDSSHAATL